MEKVGTRQNICRVLIFAQKREVYLGNYYKNIEAG